MPMRAPEIHRRQKEADEKGEAVLCKEAMFFWWHKDFPVVLGKVLANLLAIQIELIFYFLLSQQEKGAW